MKRSNALVKFLMVLALGGQSVVADTLFSTIPSGSDSTQTQLSYTETYSNGAGDIQTYNYSQAISFRATGSGLISNLTIDNLFTTGQPTGALILQIVKNVGDEPDSQLVDSFLIPDVSGTAANYTALSQLNGQLIAGQYYFLEVLPPSTYPSESPTTQGEASYVFLTSASSNDSEFEYYYEMSGTGQSAANGRTTDFPLLSINEGPAVPEPHTGVTVGGGLVVYFLVRRQLASGKKWRRTRELRRLG